MIFDTSIPEMKKKAINRIKHLLDKKAKIEVLEKKKNRTYSQNNYLHLILGWYALEYGDMLEEIKQEHFKKIVNPDIFKTEFINYQTGEVRDRWKSSAELNTEEMSLATERFRDYSIRTLNLYLPEPKDLVHLDEIKNQLEQYHNKIYL
ncbi:hypothetical protein C1637_09755 [Chryseobacterium lactis]|uniref:Uncharacterized protein n=1 Tax=Chryseobacterium lactis TaxID=1241981 RepID=A0A3G6RL64_CHRLC|nr:hypothetical protein [Chryseobacterium lactis]AZA82205.1 hypothetical protein EG342_09945 [Chryseobacterium lactis]AZB02586.1 hypothetical protein EG341_00800 [Chryseobacterium lactis]PNW14119.1 hypothetical protein C1637_09755 [Chryseobacterium lactis]